MELLFYKQFFGGKNIFIQIFLERHANKNDLWKELLTFHLLFSTLIHAGGGGLRAEGEVGLKARRPTSFSPQHASDSPRCLRSFVEMVESSSPQIFLFNEKAVYSPCSLPGSCHFQFSGKSKGMPNLTLGATGQVGKAHLMTWTVITWLK